MNSAFIADCRIELPNNLNEWQGEVKTIAAILNRASSMDWIFRMQTVLLVVWLGKVEACQILTF